jgi:hypothetical protein
MSVRKEKWCPYTVPCGQIIEMYDLVVQKGVAQCVHIKGCGRGVSVCVGVVVWLRRSELVA